MAMRLGGVIKSKGLAGVVEGGGARQIMPATPVSEEIESRRHLRFFAENDPRDTVMLLSSKGKTAQGNPINQHNKTKRTRCQQHGHSHALSHKIENHKSKNYYFFSLPTSISSSHHNLTRSG
jgi:hypothetical protein